MNKIISLSDYQTPVEVYAELGEIYGPGNWECGDILMPGVFTHGTRGDAVVDVTFTGGIAITPKNATAPMADVVVDVRGEIKGVPADPWKWPDVQIAIDALGDFKTKILSAKTSDAVPYRCEVSEHNYACIVVRREQG